MAVPVVPANSLAVAAAWPRLIAASCRRASIAARLASSKMPPSASPSMARWSSVAIARYLASSAELLGDVTRLAAHACAMSLERRIRRSVRLCHGGTEPGSGGIQFRPSGEFQSVDAAGQRM
eukprot:4496961-Heterocapsa_arctica.AAC.1